MKERERIDKILEILGGMYTSKPALNFNNPFELLIATILSAQCTDVRVNKVTEVLFKELKNPEDFVVLNSEELGQLIKSCGLYKTKSENIINTCKILITKFNSKVPNTMDELVKLPGVGRKTANVVLSNAFGVDAIAVDTHVFRVSNRLGLAESKDVEKTEYQLMENIPKKLWSKAHHWLIYHGRAICIARNPKCDVCPVAPYCKYYNISTTSNSTHSSKL